MDRGIDIAALREKMRRQLGEWIPDNEEIVEKELKIFDKIMSRREFLQVSSLAALSALLGGCFDHERQNFTKTPSEMAGELLSEEERSAISKVSKITVDSDILDSFTFYEPLVPAGSSDSSAVVKIDSVLEAINPHVTTLDPLELSLHESTGDRTLERNYGISEIVQLSQEREGEDYILSIHEKDMKSEQQAVKSTEIRLDGTGGLSFDRLIAANGNYHNRVQEGKVSCQKMILAANTSLTDSPDISIFYQSYRTALLLPGEEDIVDGEWKSDLSLIEKFREYDPDYEFESYRLLDVDSYEDGYNHNFIYGTLQFDGLYNYGFVVTFTEPDSAEPTVSFFTPQLLAKGEGVVEKLREDFGKLDIDTQETGLEDFALFSEQKFIPLAHLEKSETLFSFICPDTSSGEHEVYSDDGYSYDLGFFTSADREMMKRYLLRVDTSAGDTSILMQGYRPKELSIGVEDGIFTFDFDTSNLGSIDLGTLMPTREALSRQLKNLFIRFVQKDEEEVHLMLATSLLDERGVGVMHKSLKLGYLAENAIESFALNEHLTSLGYMDESSYQSKDYRMWFDDMKNSSPYTSLYDCVRNDYGEFQFYATHNSRNLLRSYFVVKIGESRFLLNYNESGQNPEPDDSKPFNYQTAEGLYSQIATPGAHSYFPPLPVSADVKKMLPWRSVGQDEELLFTSSRVYRVDESDNSFEENGDFSLHSYFHASLDALSGGWKRHEIHKKSSYDKDSPNLHRIEKHHVHLHMNNIYGYPVETMEENSCIELRFDAAVTVTDHSDSSKPRTYSVNRSDSIFLKPKGGSIVLEVNCGLSHEELLNSASMMYRVVKNDSFSPDSGRPLLLRDSDSDDMNSFMQCHLSFRQFERLSKNNADSYQSGMRANDSDETVHSILYGNLRGDTDTKESQSENLDKVLELYQHIYEKSAPQNDTPLDTNSMKIRPLLYTTPLTAEHPLRGDGCCSSVAKWFHKAISTIKQSVKHAAQKIVEDIKAALDKLVADIDTLMQETEYSLSTLLSSLMVYLDKIVKVVGETLILYLEKFWKLIRGYLGLDTAWAIGDELHQLATDQLTDNADYPNNLYANVKTLTGEIEESIDDAAKLMKSSLNKSIENLFSPDRNPDDNSGLDSARKLHGQYQSNSSKLHHLTYQFARVHRHINGARPDGGDALSGGEFVCSSGDTVEELIACLGREEVKSIYNGFSQSFVDSEHIFEDIIYGDGISVVENDLKKLLENTFDTLVDAMTIMEKGIVQLPLAFLNGSTILEKAEKTLDEAMEDTLKTLGVLLFGDEKRFKSIVDIGFFLCGLVLNLIFSIMDKALEGLGMHSDIDIISYIENGDLRRGMEKSSENSLLLGDEDDNIFFTVCVAIDGIFSATIPLLNWLGKRNEDIMEFLILRRILVPMGIRIRMLLYAPVLFKHIIEPMDNRTAAIISDFLHYGVLQLQYCQQWSYSFNYIKEGVDEIGKYYLVTIPHLMLYLMECGLKLALVFTITTHGKSQEHKKLMQEIKKTMEILGSIFSALGDISSLISATGDKQAGITILSMMAAGGSIIFGLASFVIAHCP